MNMFQVPKLTSQPQNRPVQQAQQPPLNRTVGNNKTCNWVFENGEVCTYPWWEIQFATNCFCYSPYSLSQLLVPIIRFVETSSYKLKRLFVLRNFAVKFLAFNLKDPKVFLDHSNNFFSKQARTIIQTKYFSNFSCRFLNSNNFFQFEL